MNHEILLNAVTANGAGAWVDVPAGDWGVYTEIKTGTASVTFEWRPSSTYLGAPLEDAAGALTHTGTNAAKLSLGDIPAYGQIRATVAGVSGGAVVTALLTPHVEHRNNARPIPEQY